MNKLYPNPDIPLDHKDAFTLLIAVLLSGQSTDARVNLITPHLFKKADNAFAMSKLSVEEIQEIIKPCGLAPQKARFIQKLSEILAKNYHGEVPRTYEELESLPGVGHKTASVVMSQAFQEPAFPVDTHIHRCAKRWGLSSGRNVKETERDLKEAFPQEDWNKVHLQIIYFAREYCKAVKHNPDICPICSKIKR